MITASAIEDLGVLVGEWETHSPQFPGIRGRTTTEWLAGGAFLIVRDSAPDPLPDNTWIVGADDDHPHQLMILHYDTRGVRRIYHGFFDGPLWRVWRDCPGFSQRITSTLDEAGNTLRASWEHSADESDPRTWDHDYDLIYTRLT